jgi:hypothetical protein
VRQNIRVIALLRLRLWNLNLVRRNIRVITLLRLCLWNLNLVRQNIRVISWKTVRVLTHQTEVQGSEPSRTKVSAP